MFKTSSLPFIGPKVTSKIKTNTPKTAPVSWGATRSISKSKSAFKVPTTVKGNLVPALSLALVLAISSIFVLHLYWINTYSSKGFALKHVQTAIEQQTEIQKKLLVKQSLMSSTYSLGDLEKTNLVPVTDSETLVDSTFAQAK